MSKKEIAQREYVCVYLRGSKTGDYLFQAMIHNWKLSHCGTVFLAAVQRAECKKFVFLFTPIGTRRMVCFICPSRIPARKQLSRSAQVVLNG